MGSSPYDWLSRATIPDLYPRKTDPYRPPQIQQNVDMTQAAEPSSTDAQQLIAQLTGPGSRPTVTQKAVTYGYSAAVTSAPLINGRVEVDGFIIDVPSTALNSVWLGFGSGVTVGTGIEIQPGIPMFFSATNTRENWELQRALEYIAALLAFQAGVDPLPPYKAPRITLSTSDWFLVASATTTMSIGLFFIPEQQ